MLMMENGGMDAHQVERDGDYGRARSCTWPQLPCPEEELRVPPVKAEPFDVPACRAERNGGGAPAELKHPTGAPVPLAAALDAAGQLRKSKSSRRNAWGNQSYADLITRAIESTPDKRLTLSQIYDWMVRFVPYFKDKGDSNSSAGWKVGYACALIMVLFCILVPEASARVLHTVGTESIHCSSSLVKKNKKTLCPPVTAAH